MTFNYYLPYQSAKYAPIQPSNQLEKQLTSAIYQNILAEQRDIDEIGRNSQRAKYLSRIRQYQTQIYMKDYLVGDLIAEGKRQAFILRERVLSQQLKYQECIRKMAAMGHITIDAMNKTTNLQFNQNINNVNQKITLKQKQQSKKKTNTIVNNQSRLRESDKFNIKFNETILSKSERSKNKSKYKSVVKQQQFGNRKDIISFSQRKQRNNNIAYSDNSQEIKLQHIGKFSPKVKQSQGRKTHKIQANNYLDDPKTKQVIQKWSKLKQKQLNNEPGSNTNKIGSIQQNCKDTNVSQRKEYSSYIQSQIHKKIEARLLLSSLVYKDSQLRNDKYQLQHLFNTYNTENRQRKQIKVKINNHQQIIQRFSLVVESK